MSSCSSCSSSPVQQYIQQLTKQSTQPEQDPIKALQANSKPATDFLSSAGNRGKVLDISA